MTENPYSTLDAPSSPEEGSRSRVCTIMFWLSCALCLIAFGIAANGTYQYWYFTTQVSLTVPASVLAESAFIAVSGVSMLCATIAWRRQSSRKGSVLFIAALVTFFVGPLLV